MSTQMKLTRIWPVMAVALTAVAVSGCGGGGDSDTSYTGRVRDAGTGDGIVGAQVEIGQDPARTTVTGGVYVLQSVPTGPREVTVSAAGYITYEGTITFTADAATKTIPDILLVADSEQPPSPPAF